MTRKLTTKETDKAAWAVGIILEFSDMLLNANYNFTDETYKLVKKANQHLADNFTHEEQIELFQLAFALEGAK